MNSGRSAALISGTGRRPGLTYWRSCRDLTMQRAATPASGTGTNARRYSPTPCRPAFQAQGNSRSSSWALVRPETKRSLQQGRKALLLRDLAVRPTNAECRVQGGEDADGRVLPGVDGQAGP